MTRAEPAAPASTIREAHLVVRRTARYAVLGEPSDRTRQLWLACHGYGQLARRFAERLRPLDDGTRLVVAPEALSRYYLDPRGGRGPDPHVGASWMTREDREHEIDDQVAYLTALHDEVLAPLRGRATLHVLGFSQGVATVCRWLARSRVGAEQVILWGGTVPADVDLADPANPLRGARLALVAGSGDDYATDAVVATQAAALTAAGIAFEQVRFEGKHRLDDAVLARLAASPA